MPETLVLLHGFAGTRRAWDATVAALGGESYRPLALDIRGHGARSTARPVDFAHCTEDVLGAAPERFALCGYSLGGRLALHVALAAPERVTRLVLVATTAGIEDASERAARRAADERLAAQMEAMSPQQFADHWTAQPLFAGTPRQALASWREDILRNDPAALAEALRGVGAGVMEPLWNRLGDLGMPAGVVAGERDAKYVTIARRLAAALGDATLHLVPDAGHGLPREAPREIAHVVSI